MEIALRKAATFIQAAGLAASKVDLETTLRFSSHTLSEGTGFAALLASSSKTLAERIQTVLDLQETISIIRALRGIANQRKVNALLSEKQALDAQEKVLAAITDQKTGTESRLSRYGLDDAVRVEHDEDAVRNAFLNIKKRSATQTSGALPNIELPALTEEVLQTYETRLMSIRRRKQDVQDELAAENISQKINLPDKAVAVLRKHGIVG